MGQVEEKREPMVEDANDNNSNPDNVNPVTSIKTEVCVHAYVCVYVHSTYIHVL